MFGARLYSTGVDLWAVGCIIAEMLLRLPFLPGDTDLGQLSKIFEFFGSPNEDNWPGVKALPDYVEFKALPPQSFSDVFSAAGDDLIQLLESSMRLDPSKRYDKYGCVATSGHVVFMSSRIFHVFNTMT